MAVKTRRMTSTTTTAERKATVEEMLREIAYVLHVTRKVNQEIHWPVVDMAKRPKQQADEHATAAV